MIPQIGKDYYLFHSLIGSYKSEFTNMMRNKGRDVDSEKFFNFYYGGKSVNEIEKSMGLDFREVICCASKKNPAVVYHRPYGLILSGDVSAIFDNDSGISMSSKGTYPSEQHYKFANEITIENLMNRWYYNFEKSSNFTWNEVILKPGSQIIGAFHYPSFDAKILNHAYLCTFKDKEYEKFLEKVDELNLDLIEINPKFKI